MLPSYTCFLLCVNINVIPNFVIDGGTQTVLVLPNQDCLYLSTGAINGQWQEKLLLYRLICLCKSWHCGSRDEVWLIFEEGKLQRTGHDWHFRGRQLMETG
ncbi:hypothetical protein Ancab_035078 [Ancistrocladus abbreviatus]